MDINAPPNERTLGNQRNYPPEKDSSERTKLPHKVEIKNDIAFFMIL